MNPRDTMKHVVPSVVLVGLALVLASCDLTDLNKNPNAPETVPPEFVLSDVIIATAYTYQQTSWWDKPASAGRYITKIRHAGDGLFDWEPVGWDARYRILSNNRSLYKLAEAEGQTHHMAISLILEVFNFAYLTDVYGDIPYREALRSKEDGIIHPVYTPQAEIYPALLADLEKANELLASPGAIAPEADVLYQGDALKWRKFANSLRLRLLLRASARLPSAFVDIQEIVNNPSKYPLFESNEDNASVPYLGGVEANSWPTGPHGSSGFRSEFTRRRPSKELVDALIARDDPRLEIWFAPVAADPQTGMVDTSTYVGVPHAIFVPYEYNGGEDHISLLADMYTQDSHPLVQAMLMNYTEVCFVLAEAVQRGEITVPGETAESLYLKGIKASMDQYGVAEEAEARGYYEQPNVVYDGTLEQLITQKWIAMWMTGAEGWFDHRRTGYPAFELGPRSRTDQIPLRYLYPTSERATNEESYLAAVQQQGPDELFTRMWYLIE